MKRLLNTVKERESPAKEKLLSVLLPGALLLTLLTAWQLIVTGAKVEVWLLPTPTRIIESFWQAKGLFWEHSLQTLLETGMGFLAAVLVGVILGTLIDASAFLRRAVYPLLVASQTVPIIAVAPLFIMWFGYGLLPKIVVVALVCFFPVTVNIADGYRMVDQEKVRVMSAMGANPVQIFRLVKLPATLPFFFSGLRIAGTYSVMGAVIGEWLGASKGLGILMTRSSQSFLTDRVFATIMVITVLSLAITALIEIMSRILMPWYYK